MQLLKINGLYANMLVKTAHKLYPKELLRETELERGEWVTALAEVDDIDLMATRFLDLQEKLIISSCSTDLPGQPRRTKHHGDVSRPQVAYEYLTSSASIDIHNHFRTGSLGLEDVWKTKCPQMRQAAGVFGFLFTNAFLAYKFLVNKGKDISHHSFKLKLANALMSYKEASARPTRGIAPQTDGAPSPVHVLKALEKPTVDKSGKPRQFKRYQKYCFYCQHNPAQEPVSQKTSYHCVACIGTNGEVYPLCSPDTGRDCFEKHIKHGLPQKRRFLK